MSREVITVAGAVDPDALRITSMHEHVLTDGSCYLPGRPTVVDGDLSLENLGRVRREFNVNEHNVVVDDLDLVEAELGEFAAAGGRTVVDMSVPGLRMHAGELIGISERSGVQIVAGTGLYIEASRPDRFRDVGTDELANWMVEEIEVGIGETGVRAGHIGELGITELDDGDQQLLRAAVRAAAATGVLISIHPGFELGTDGCAIADVLESEGAQPERIVIGHADAFLVEHSVERLVGDPSSWTLQLDYHRELLGRGYNLSFDCLGHEWGRESEGWVIEGDWQRMAGLVALLREGYADQLVLGCDVFMRCLMRRGGGHGYAWLLEWVLPTLRAHGIDNQTIERLTVANPARLLARDRERRAAVA